MIINILHALKWCATSVSQSCRNPRRQIHGEQTMQPPVGVRSMKTKRCPRQRSATIPWATAWRRAGKC